MGSCHSFRCAHQRAARRHSRWHDNGPTTFPDSSLAIVSNVLSVLPIVLGFNWVAERLADKPLVGRLITGLIRRARSKEEMVKKHGVWAVTLFVAIPLPVTGAWTGSLVAAVFGMRFGRVLFCLTVGVIIASAIITSLTLAGVHIFSALAAVP